MLCIALLAFVIVEEASPAHAAMDAAEISVALDTTNADGATLTQGSSNLPDTPVSPDAPAHHCCAAHTANTPLPHAGGLLTQVTLRVHAPRDTQAALSSALDGLERPPKALAIA